MTASPAMAEDFHIYAGEVAPLNYQDASGQAKGFIVDLLQEIMLRVGKTVDPDNVHFYPWARCMKEVASGSGGILLSAVRSPEREGLFRWIGPVASVRFGLIGRRDRHLPLLGDDLSGYRIGVIRDSAPVQILINKYGLDESTLLALTETEQQFLMLELGRVDMIAQSDVSSGFFLDRLGLNPDTFEMVKVLAHPDLYLAFSPDTDDEFIRAAQKTLEDIQAPRPDGSSLYEDMEKVHRVHSAILIREP
ncbi:MAG: transporter substrate-binding domain-containing protein [Proteobacteria bacterium]|nr:transporter substrate-binding domain-containing protein [Pseudomonadota bacterium]MBU1612382.1 transporter substrate-binding domain-containing protein [Pseudomonadota bacterium]